MPYFPELNILLIHIPKTGGTSIEKYFGNKINKKLTYKNLYSSNDEILYGHSLQHLTYSEIYGIKNILNINFNEINIISVIRNPYERIISDLFYNKIINIYSKPDDVAYNIYLYISSKNTYDNHKIPQYKFLLDSNNKINNKILILKTETLKDDMRKIGFTDFNFNELKNKNNNINYYEYLNNNSLSLINNYYYKDFYIFSYDIINSSYIENINSKNYMNKHYYLYVYKLFFILLLLILIIYFIWNKKKYSNLNIVK